ncbi:zinc finger protein 749-like isoform X2 [Culex quinquefasciatus]|uniref:zinc finger protein 749-like isoform X2 n=1 Tax=Culex quinquefasciatus TaxID=7176 RepID=UPI0018E37617|nr:zinc finger protein 749-like isoform X2 [Culex quinquefasciatus]
MAKITVKTEPDYEMHSTLEDQQTQQEGSEDMTSFCYETVVKEEVILEDEFISPEEESARECNKAFATENKSHIKRAHEKHAQKSSEVSVLEEDGVFICSKCNKTFEERHLCQQHISKHFSLTKERTVSCPKCPKKFLSEKHLAKHEAWHEASIKNKVK